MCEMVSLLQGEITWMRGSAVSKWCRRAAGAFWHCMEELMLHVRAVLPPFGPSWVMPPRN